MSSSVKAEVKFSKGINVIPKRNPQSEDTTKLLLLFKEKYESQEGCGPQKLCEYLMGHMLGHRLRSKLPQFKAEVKNTKDSVSYRQKGNEYFILGDNINAIEYYTKSLAYADNQELMAYAHANRSAALYRQKMFKECLIDVNTALSLGYPEEKRSKLIQRKAKTLSILRMAITMKKPLSKEYKSLENIFEGISDKNNEKEIKPANLTEEDIYKRVMANIKNVKTPRFIIDEGPPKILYGPNREAPAVSDGVKIVYSETFGRHLVATKDFNPGDVISIEKPFTYSLDFGRFYTHCHHCLRKCYNLIPCHVCPIAQYCSEECRKAAWSSVHNIECPILVLLVSALNDDVTDIKVALTTLRFFIILTKRGKGINDLRQNLKIAQLNTDKRTAGFTDEGILDSTCARSALSLTANMTGLPVFAIQIFADICTLLAILLATETNFYGKQCRMENLVDSEIFQDLIFCAAVLLRASLIVCPNSYSIPGNFAFSAGSGLFILHSLYNHSCESNSFWHFDGLTLITRACKPIRSGEQIFVNYGPACADFPKEERKKILLRSFFFDCKCQACAENWPTHVEILENYADSFKRCTTHIQAIEFIIRARPLALRLVKNKYDIEAIKSVLQLLNAIMEKPCQELIYFENELVTYYMEA